MKGYSTLPKKNLGNFLTEISMGITSPFGLRSRSLCNLLRFCIPVPGIFSLPKREKIFFPRFGCYNWALRAQIKLCELGSRSQVPWEVTLPFHKNCGRASGPVAAFLPYSQLVDMNCQARPQFKLQHKLRQMRPELTLNLDSDRPPTPPQTFLHS